MNKWGVALHRVLCFLKKRAINRFIGMLRQLAEASPLPWCIIRDFNDLMLSDEKKGGQQHPRALLAGFSETVMNCGLNDSGFNGERFTWERSRGTNRWVQERSDRGLAMKKWNWLFPVTEVIVLEVLISDYMPLYLQLHKQVYVPRARRIRIEIMWVHEKDCYNIIQDCWNTKGDNDLLSKMASYSVRLEEWGGGMLKKMKVKMVNYRKEMQRLRSRRDATDIPRYGEIHWDYLRLLEK